VHCNLCQKRFLEGSTIPICHNKEPKRGKYTAENGPTKAAICFTAIWGIHVNELTARRLKSEYLGKSKEAVVSKIKFAVGEESKSKEITVDALETKWKGRSLLLGVDLDVAAGLEEGTWDWSGKTYEVAGVDLDFCNGGSR